MRKPQGLLKWIISWHLTQSPSKNEGGFHTGLTGTAETKWRVNWRGLNLILWDKSLHVKRMQGIYSKKTFSRGVLNKMTHVSGMTSVLDLEFLHFVISLWIFLYFLNIQRSRNCRCFTALISVGFILFTLSNRFIFGCVFFYSFPTCLTSMSVWWRGA